MYYEVAKIRSKKILCSIIIALLTPFVAILGILLLYVLLTHNEGEALNAVLAFLFVTVIIYIRSIRQVKRAHIVQRINHMLEQDEDGLIPIADIAQQLGMEQRHFLRIFIDAVGKAQLRRCSIYPEDPTYIILDNGSLKIKERFRATHCKVCGAANVIRLGLDEHCKYCGSKIES